MKGLKTQESIKFNNFFSLIQEEAQKNGSVFFADAGDGGCFETDTMEGEIMMGWLIPLENESEFEMLWDSSAVDDSWSDYYVWAVWTIKDDGISIRFVE